MSFKKMSLFVVAISLIASDVFAFSFFTRRSKVGFRYPSHGKMAPASSPCNPYRIKNNERQLLYCTCQNEAGKEPDLGQKYVVYTIRKRALLGKIAGFADTLGGVITQGWGTQFSWIKYGPFNAPSTKCVQNVNRALNDRLPANTPDHYHANYVNPRWGYKQVAYIGAHKFFSQFKTPNVPYRKYNTPSNIFNPFGNTVAMADIELNNILGF